MQRRQDGATIVDKCAAIRAERPRQPRKHAGRVVDGVDPTVWTPSELKSNRCEGRLAPSTVVDAHPRVGPLEGEPASHKLVKIGHVRLGRLLDHAYDLP